MQVRQQGVKYEYFSKKQVILGFILFTLRSPGGRGGGGSNPKPPLILATCILEQILFQTMKDDVNCGVCAFHYCLFINDYNLVPVA